MSFTPDLSAAHRRPSDCLDQMPALLWSTDRQFRLTGLAGASLPQWPTPAASLLGQPIQLLLPAGAPNTDLVRAHRLARRGSTATFSCRLGPDWYQGTVAPWRNPLGKIGGCLGIALNSSGRQASQQQFAQAHERQRWRLSYELSEKLAQHLVGICWQLQSLQPHLADSGQKPLAATAESLQTGVRNACELAQRLYPAELERLGFLAALEILLNAQQTVYGVRCGLVADAAYESVEPSWGIQLYRLIESALLYLVSSGQPRHLEVQLRANPKSWGLQVTSQGTPQTNCATSAAESERCLLGQRIELLGGSWRLRPRADGGAKIICALPRHDLP